MNAEETEKLGEWMRGIFPMSPAESIAFVMQHSAKFSYAVAYRAVDEHRIANNFLNPTDVLKAMNEAINPAPVPMTAKDREKAEADAFANRQRKRDAEIAATEAEHQKMREDFAALSPEEFSRRVELAKARHGDLPMFQSILSKPRERMGLGTISLILHADEPAKNLFQEA